MARFCSEIFYQRDTILALNGNFAKSLIKWNGSLFGDHLERFSAWRCGGNLAQKFNRITALEPCTNVS